MTSCQQEVVGPTPITIVITQESGMETVVTRVVRQTIEVVTTPLHEEVVAPVVLDIPMIGSSGVLDPQLADDKNSYDLVENLFVGLTRLNNSSTRIEPALAQEWSTSSDGLVWTFQLRDDIYWIDREDASPGILPAVGEGGPKALRPVDAYDLVYTIQRACDQRTNSPDIFILFIIEGCENLFNKSEVNSADLESVGVRALDSFTVEFTLNEPASHFLTITSTPIMRPVPIEHIDEMGDEWHLIEEIITSGPYLLGPDSVTDVRTVLVRNPYWPIPIAGNIDRVNILHLDEPMDAFELWEDRLLDSSPVPTNMQDFALNQYQSKAHFTNDQSVFYLAYNFDSQAFSIPEVRQAFGMAIDRERLIREVHDGLGRPMRHLGPPGTVGAPPIDQVGSGYSPDRARQLMDASPFGDCRLLPELTYLVSSSDRALQQAELLRDMWEDELGCSKEQIKIEQVQFGTLLANTRSDAGAMRPDLWDLGWSAYFPDEDNWLGQVLHCTGSENRQNRPCDPVDDIISRADTVQDTDERWELYRQAERALFGEDAVEPITPLLVRGSYTLKHSWLNYSPSSFGGEQFDSYYLDSGQKHLERAR